MWKGLRKKKRERVIARRKEMEEEQMMVNIEGSGKKKDCGWKMMNKKGKRKGSSHER